MQTAHDLRRISRGFLPKKSSFKNIGLITQPPPTSGFDKFNGNLITPVPGCSAGRSDRKNPWRSWWKIHLFTTPKWPLFLKVKPSKRRPKIQAKQGPHLGFRYMIEGLFSCYNLCTSSTSRTCQYQPDPNASHVCRPAQGLGRDLRRLSCAWEPWPMKNKIVNWRWEEKTTNKYHPQMGSG